MKKRNKKPRIESRLVRLLLFFTFTILILPLFSEAGRAYDIGFGLGLNKESIELVPKLTHEKDFADLMLRTQATIDLAKDVNNRGLALACFARCLYAGTSDSPGQEDPRVCEKAMDETVNTAIENGVTCNYLNYNPEDREGTPHFEFDDFLGSVIKAQEIAHNYGAGLVVGPGLRYMNEHEELYSQAAPYADVWLLQSQRLQINEETGERVPPEEYRAQVERIINMLQEGNPDIKIWVQISVHPGKYGHENPFSAEEIFSLALAIEDLIDAFRIYCQDDPNSIQTLSTVIELLRNQKKQGDINGDGSVDIIDLIIIGLNLGKTQDFNPDYDLNNDGKIDLFDLVVVAKNFGT